MKRLLISLLGCMLLSGACSPKVSTKLTKTYPEIDYRQDIVVLDIQTEVPSDAEVLGTVKVGDSGFSTKGDWTTVLEKAKLEVRKAGGNALKITRHQFPDMASTIHRLSGQILRIDNVDRLVLEEVKAPEHPDCAILYVYRGAGAALLNYDLHLGDSTVCRVGNKFKQAVRITRPGTYEVWARTEKKESLFLDVELGKDYYLRCSVSMGIAVGRPMLELVDSRDGKAEYDALETKKKNQ